MPAVQDFRRFPFHLPRVERCGRFIGRKSYWKLYAVENFLRIVIHSVLLAQIGPDWWELAVDRKVRQTAAQFRKKYAKRPWHTPAGPHDIYYVYLRDLNNIIRANSNLFLPVVADVDSWVAKIEGVNIPRNLIGHMNFPGQPDRLRIDELHVDFVKLVTSLERSGLPIRIP